MNEGCLLKHNNLCQLGSVGSIARAYLSQSNSLTGIITVLLLTIPVQNPVNPAIAQCTVF